ncbi:uncharacterized protein LOC129288184 isoform X2 [Prosopis cineraria]|uniref:uncharacterized protein LOC129288184 isoform X2 n=1 Tax=Prosopis cineraria TaxID=364024 RepID=UPI00240FABD8|nr:uncharacterized protein LOC129288184 isoform X2 [Prosopis cineraria]
MASAISLPRSLSTLVLSRPRFPPSRMHRNMWINASGASRLSYFPLSHSHSPYLPLPLCHPVPLPPSPLHFLRQPSSPPFRRSVSLMTSPPASSASDHSSPTKTGVWYRNWTIENATQLGLKGWVRNRKDGSVEALFSGSPEAVQEMERRCRRGPPDAVVTGLEVFPSQDDPGTAFERKPTV